MGYVFRFLTDGDTQSMVNEEVFDIGTHTHTCHSTLTHSPSHMSLHTHTCHFTRHSTLTHSPSHVTTHSLTLPTRVFSCRSPSHSLSLYTHTHSLSTPPPHHTHKHTLTTVIVLFVVDGKCCDGWV